MMSSVAPAMAQSKGSNNELSLFGSFCHNARSPQPPAGSSCHCGLSHVSDNMMCLFIQTPHGAGVSVALFVAVMVGETPNSAVVLFTFAFLTNLAMSHSGFQLHLMSKRGFSHSSAGSVSPGELCGLRMGPSRTPNHFSCQQELVLAGLLSQV